MTIYDEIKALHKEYESLNCELTYCETDWVNYYDRSIQIRRRMDEIDARLQELNQYIEDHTI